jgi:hypothetical protein
LHDRESRTMNKQLTSFGLMLGAGLVQAHEGHGLPGASHWHADNVALLLGVVVVAALGLWFSRRK